MQGGELVLWQWQAPCWLRAAGTCTWWDSYQSQPDSADASLCLWKMMLQKGKWCITIFFPSHPSGSIKYCNLSISIAREKLEANTEKYDGALKFFFLIKDLKKPLALVPPERLPYASSNCCFNLWNAEECSINQMSFRATRFVFYNWSRNRLIFIILGSVTKVVALKHGPDLSGDDCCSTFASHLCSHHLLHFLSVVVWTLYHSWRWPEERCFISLLQQKAFVGVWGALNFQGTHSLH